MLGSNSTPFRTVCPPDAIASIESIAQIADWACIVRPAAHVRSKGASEWVGMAVAAHVRSKGASEWVGMAVASEWVGMAVAAHVRSKGASEWVGMAVAAPVRSSWGMAVGT